MLSIALPKGRILTPDRSLISYRVYLGWNPIGHLIHDLRDGTTEMIPSGPIDADLYMAHLRSKGISPSSEREQDYLSSMIDLLTIS